MQPTYNDKRVIWESKQKQVGLIVLNFLFVVAIIYTRGMSSSFSFWAALTFFGGIGLFLMTRLLNPKNLFVTQDSKLGKKILAEQFHREQESLGFFSYTERGFIMAENSRVKSYRWADFDTIFGFKEDRFTTDEICMDIFFSDSASLRLTESTPGWYQFQKRLSEHIPSIPNDWGGEIAVPAFETKLTLLFDRKGRTLKEAEAACYLK
jgi:hypothetical protein